VTRQRRLNAYFENRPDQDKTKIAVYGTPGLQQLFTIGANPLRGFSGDQSYLYAVSGSTFYQVLPKNGFVEATGTLNTSSGNCTIQVSPTQVIIVDSNVGYCFTGGVLRTIVPWQASGAKTVTFCSGFFVAEQPGTQTFWVSNAFDGTTWGALSFAAASGDSDTIQAVDQLNGVLLIFMGTGMEFWQNVGGIPEPFQPILSAYNEWGLAAVFSRSHVDQSIIFLGRTKSGQVQLVKLTSFATQVISDADTEITFPTANRSWIFDQSTGLPSEVQTGSSVPATRHWGNLSALSAGNIFISDYATNAIYQMNTTMYTDNGQTIVRELISRHILSMFNRVRISLLYLDMETGVGLQNGQGSNPQIMLQSSKDNGRTWSAERWESLGKVGQYLSRVVWRRFGSARDYVFKFRMTDPVKFVITEGAIKLSERQPAAKLG
jgi:hypothetical protein